MATEASDSRLTTAWLPTSATKTPPAAKLTKKKTVPASSTSTSNTPRAAEKDALAPTHHRPIPQGLADTGNLLFKQKGERVQLHHEPGRQRRHEEPLSQMPGGRLAEPASEDYITHQQE